MNIRHQCPEILQQILEEKVFFSALKSKVDEKDAPFANMLVLTVLRQLVPLQKMLKKFLTRKLPDKMRHVHYVLLCGAAEILYMDTPDYAALNEYVTIAKKQSDRFVGGMVNAVLRKIAKEKDALLKENSEEFFPEKFKQIILRSYDQEVLKNIEKMVACEVPLDVSVKQEAEQWVEKLSGTLMANGTIRLESPKVKIPALAGFADGQWWIQDLASALPISLIGDVAGKNVLDICAAPGGKTAQLLARGANVCAVDIDFERMEKLKENIKRLKLAENLQTEVADGKDYLKANGHKFDVVVLDAPCSATGTFRRHPEVLHIKGIKDVKKQVIIQEEMLEACAQSLKIGAVLLYSVCSIAKEEGELQIEKFLLKHPEFELLEAQDEKINQLNAQKLDDRIIDKGVLRTLPYHMQEFGGMDAFFAACLEKKR